MTDDDAEFAAYFAARLSATRRLAYALCGDWHTADDLVQTTFVKLNPRWRRLREVQIDAYVRKSLVNTFLTHRHRNRREDVGADVPERAAPAVERHDDLGRALQALPAQQRAVVVLRHLEDMSIADVAELLQIAEGTVKSQASRGLAALRTAMAATTDSPAARSPDRNPAAARSPGRNSPAAHLPGPHSPGVNSPARSSARPASEEL